MFITIIAELVHIYIYIYVQYSVGCKTVSDKIEH